MTKAFIACLGFLIISSSASALELGAILGIRDDTLSTSVTGANVNATFGGWQIGGLAFIDLFPMFQARTGLIYKTRHMTGTVQYFGSVDFNSTENTFDFPLDLQVNFPFGLYAFAGAMYSTDAFYTCSTGNGVVTCPSQQVDDIPLNIGVGYNIVNSGIIKFSMEAEFDQGTRNLNTSANPGTSYFQGFVIDALVRVGL